MSQQDLLRYEVETLHHAGIEYMITGSIASSLQGELRSTHDLDVVVAVRAEDVPALVAAFPSPRFYLSEDAVLWGSSQGVESGGYDPGEAAVVEDIGRK